ncbi:MAG: sensor histidine kinase [Streptosporangiaceae bacterium]
MHHVSADLATAAEAAERSPRGVLAAAREHPVATDRVLTAVLTAVSLAGLWLVSWSKTAHYRAPDAGGVLLTLAIVVPLLWRRQRPGLVLVISGAALLGYDAAGYPSGLAWLACYWAVYSLAVHRRQRDAYWPLAVWVAVVLAHLALPARGSNTAQTALIFLGVTAVVWLRGDAVRTGALEAERERELRARQAVADERTRIARELHDVVSQALGVIVMQAGGAGSVPILEEPDAKAVLATIEQTGRQAFAEMRRLVGVLRDDGEAAALAPQPTIAEIPALLARFAGAGLDVDLEVEGTRREAPAGVELSAYRIVQEALTNTLKHSGAGHASVRLAWSQGHLDVEVSDDGPAAGAVPSPVRADSGGKGLVGMRERVVLFGGELKAGPSPHGGYQVAARLPLEGMA